MPSTSCSPCQASARDHDRIAEFGSTELQLTGTGTLPTAKPGTARDIVAVGDTLQVREAGRRLHPALDRFPWLADPDAGDLRTPLDAVRAAAGQDVAFEVDHMDEATSQGWSVLAVGPARIVRDPEAVRRLVERARTSPWAGGDREMWVSIQPVRLTGRQIGPTDR